MVRLCTLQHRASVESLENRRLLSSAVPALQSSLGPPEVGSARQVEYLNRGLVAMRTSSNSTGSIYVGWRMLGTDPGTISFNLYCSTNGAAPQLIHSTSTTTNFVHTNQNYSQSHAYFVRPVVSGVEQAASETFTLAGGAPAQQYLNVPLQIPAGGTTPDNVAYTYSANDASVGDLDGDGQYEIVLKWDPSNSKDNSQSGYTGNVYIDAYRLDGTLMWRIDLGRNIRAGAHYTQFMVYDLDGDGRAEVAMKTAPGTIDGTGDPVLLGSDSVNADYRNASGYILSGPEYLTIFDGLTGANLATTNYIVPRGTVSSWGDSYGNRVDRFLAAVAYLDGQRPSLVMARGYYTRATLAAWDWRNGQLTQRWLFDSNTAGNSAYAGQGNHNLSVADVDADGKDEIVYGSATIDDNGQGLYSTGLGHGDALHVSDMIPSRPGLEVFQIHESESAHQGRGGTLRDARTGEIISFVPGAGDVGRGVAFDIDPNYPGYEMWTSADSGLYNADGTRIQDRGNAFYNFGVWWDADPLRELLDGTTIADWRITNGVGGRFNYVYAPAGLSSNNGTKSTPALSADLLGDWREEVIWRRSDSTALQIWTTTIPATMRLFTLMHDTQYRTAIAWQNVAYNQPPHPSFFLGDGMSTPTANVYVVGGGVVAPEAPQIQSATAVNINRINLAWSEVAGATSYRVKRATTSGGPYTTIASGITSASYSDTTANGGTTYYYVVSAMGIGGESADSAQASATTPAPVIYQAEAATYGGSTTIFETTNSGFNSSGYVNFSTTGGYLQFDNVHGAAGGSEIKLRFRYALGATTARTGNLIINGVAQSITFNPTGAWTTWAYHDFVAPLNAGATNTIRLESTGQDLANIDELRVDVVPDLAAPTISASSFYFETAPNRLAFTFSEDVSASLGIDDLIVSRIGGGSVVASGLTWDSLTNTATFALPTPLPDGNYTASFAGGSVTDSQGNALGSGVVIEFFALAGDANRDRIVDITDLGILATNWQATGKGFSEADFNYDTTVDISDLGILATNWQKTMPAPSALAGMRAARRVPRVIEQISPDPAPILA